MDRRLNLPPDWADQRVAVHVIGAGGTGSALLDSVASLDATLRRLGHPGFALTIHDGDTVSASNIGRARYTPNDVGHNKAILSAHRFNNFYELDWTASPLDAQPAQLADADLVITCVDKAGFRASLATHFRRCPTNALWLDMGNGEIEPGRHGGQVVLGHLGGRRHKHRIPNVFDLYPEMATMRAVDAEAPSCSSEAAVQRQPPPVNRAIAMLAYDLLWTLFREGSLAIHGYLARIAPMQVTPLPIDPATWGFFGYAEAA